MKRLRIYQDLRYREHPAGEGHVESPERLRAVEAAIEKSALLKEAEYSDAVFVDPILLKKVHDEEYLKRIEGLCNESAIISTAEIEVSPKSWTAAQLAAGASVDAVKSLLANEIDCAFVAPRPPGHHAESKRALGFCFINNIAVAAMSALESGLQRIAILDWDLHHGNGTQQIFWNDPRVLFMSIHQYSLYPSWSGNEDETGGPLAPGLTINLPLLPDSGDEELPGLFEQRLTPAVKSFQPALVLISAGFDGHYGDPLGQLCYTEAGFAYMTKEAMKWGKANGCGIVSILEGGYNLQTLADSTVVHLETLIRGE